MERDARVGAGLEPALERDHQEGPAEREAGEGHRQIEEHHYI